jgi:hypothetical protein
VIAASAHVRGDPFSLEEYLDRPCGQTSVNFGAGEAMRHAVIMGGNIDVIIDASFLISPVYLAFPHGGARMVSQPFPSHF